MQVYSTDAVPQKDRFAYWRDALTQHFIHLAPEASDRANFSSAIYARDLAGYSFSRVIAGTQRIHRTKREIARSPHDLLFINLQLRGRGSYRQNGGETALRPGDLFIIDAREPFELGCPAPLSQISLKVPRALIVDGLLKDDAASGFFVSGVSYFGRLFGDYLFAQWKANEASDEIREHGAIENIAALIVFEINRQNRAARLPRPAYRAALYETAKRIIRKQCADPSLAPLAISKSAGVSLRTLQAVFAENDNAVAREILSSRLALTAQMLKSASKRHLKIGEIGFSAGFNDLSHFTHAFVRRYGRTPSEWRNSD